MEIDNFLTNIKLHNKILYCILILFIKKTKKSAILILFNIIGQIKNIILLSVKILSKIINKHISLCILKITIISYTVIIIFILLLNLRSLNL